MVKSHFMHLLVVGHQVLEQSDGAYLHKLGLDEGFPPRVEGSEEGVEVGKLANEVIDVEPIVSSDELTVHVHLLSQAVYPLVLFVLEDGVEE